MTISENKTRTNELKKPSTKVVDNLKTQLLELLDSLNKLQETIELELTRLVSEFDEINSIVIDGFRNVLDQRPPIDPVPDAESRSESGSLTDEGDDEDNSSLYEDGEDHDEVEKDDAGDRKSSNKDEARKESMNNIMRMLHSWSG